MKKILSSVTAIFVCLNADSMDFSRRYRSATEFLQNCSFSNLSRIRSSIENLKWGMGLLEKKDNPEIVKTGEDILCECFSSLSEVPAEHKEDMHIATFLFFIAATRGHEKLLTVLITEFGLDPDEEINPEILGRFAEKNAIDEIPFRRETHQNTTALFFATQARNKKIVNLLLQLKANPNKITYNNATPFVIGAATGDLEIFELLHRFGGNVDMVLDATGATPLFMAAQEGHANIVRFILSKSRSTINLPDKVAGNTPLIIAVKKNRQDVVRALLECDELEIDKTGELKRTALQWSVNNNSLGLAGLLMNRGANPNEKFASGTPILLFATQYKWTAMMELLLAHGAFVNDVDDANEKITSLLVAVSHQHVDGAKLLMSWGADLDAVGGSLDYSPLCYAVATGNLRMVEEILGFRRFIAHEDGTIDVTKANVDLADNQGLTPVYIATQTRRGDILKALLLAGANPNIPNDREIFPLVLARDWGYFDMAKILIDAGADPKVKKPSKIVEVED